MMSISKHNQRNPRDQHNQTGRRSPSLMLSTLLKQAVLDAKGEPVGKLADVIVALRRDDCPRVTGLVARIGNGHVFVPVNRVVAIEADRIELRSAKLDLRPFTRRPGEVLLREDVLGHRLVDVDRALLVRAYDVQLTATEEGWVASGLDVHRRRVLHGVRQLTARHEQHPVRDWRSFEALIGHEPSLLSRSPFGQLRRLKAAQIADLIEDASQAELEELLAHVHADPELEAHVFEELDDDQQAQLLRSLPTAQVVEVLAHMRADDAADAIMDLSQPRRSEVLEGLPERQQAKVRTLLGYNDATAGGLMGVDYLALPDTATVQDAVDAVRASTTAQPEALSTIFTVDGSGRLTGALGLVHALQADPTSALETVADRSPVHAHPDDDLVGLTRQMADFNLLVLPVIDPGRTLLGVITVDDALEAAIPRDWMRRDVNHHPLPLPAEDDAHTNPTGSSS